jgi:AbrB family looped-hinge helix DNA binding protein
MAATVKLSSKYQVVIPREVRRMLNWRPGQEVSVVPMGGGLVALVPYEDLASLEGAFPQVSMEDIRDESERDLG